MQQIVDSLIV